MVLSGQASYGIRAPFAHAHGCSVATSQPQFGFPSFQCGTTTNPVWLHQPHAQQAARARARITVLWCCPTRLPMQSEPHLLIPARPVWQYHSASVALPHPSVTPPQPQCGSISNTHSKLRANARARARIALLCCCPTRLRMQSEPQLLIPIVPVWLHHSPSAASPHPSVAPRQPQCGSTSPMHSKLRARSRITVLLCYPTRLRMQSEPQLLTPIAPV